MPGRDGPPRSNAARRGISTPLQVARTKVVALGSGLITVAGGRNLMPWVHPAAMPKLDYPKVFVVGCPRSGTTWVAEMLARHPQVISGRESHIYPNVHETVGRGRYSVRAWAHLFYGLARGAQLHKEAGLQHFVDRTTLVSLGQTVLAQDGDDDAVSKDLIRAVLDSYFVRAGGTREQVLVEKTPRHISYAEQILADHPDARVLEVVRDGRDVCVSMQMRAHHVAGLPTERTRQIAIWIRSVRLGLALRQKPDLRDRVTVVRYEDLKADVAGETERLFADIGLRASPELVTDIAAATDISRYPPGTGEFRYRGDTGAWVDHFSPEDNRLFRELVGDLFEQVGYSY